jgi:hypothetical protein
VWFQLAAGPTPELPSGRALLIIQNTADDDPAWGELPGQMAEGQPYGSLGMLLLALLEMMRGQLQHLA